MQSKTAESYQEDQLKNFSLTWLIMAMEKGNSFIKELAQNPAGMGVDMVKKASENEFVKEVAKNSKTSVDKGIEIVKKYPLQTVLVTLVALRVLRKKK